MKKILIVCRAYYPNIGGGGEYSTKTLAEMLLGIGYKVEVLTIYNKDVVDEISGVKITRVKFKNVYWSMHKGKGTFNKILWHLIDSNNLLLKKTLTRKIEEINPDVLISSTIEDVSSIIWKIAKEKDIRTVHIIRSYSLMCVNANMFKADNCINQCSSCKLMTLSKKNNSKYVDDVVGISRFVLEKHIQSGYFPKARKHIIYNSCIEDVLDERKYDGFLDCNFKIGFLGRIHKTKGIECLIQSVNNIPEKLRRSITILVAGEGDEKYIEELKKSCSSMQFKYEFLGGLPASKFLDMLDVLVVPSQWNEPFGRVIVESMGRKVPVIGSAVGGIPELLAFNEDFLFSTDQELTDILVNFFERKISFNFKLERFMDESIGKSWIGLLDGTEL